MHFDEVYSLVSHLQFLPYPSPPPPPPHSLSLKPGLVLPACVRIWNYLLEHGDFQRLQP